jgi:predicted Zn-dependent peptidase
MQESVRITRLGNGLTVATDRMESVETVTVGVWSAIGTRHEAAQENGVAHLIEHMAFKGTQRRSARDIAIEIEAVGGYLNAYTGREQTAYYAKILARDLDLAVDLLGDIVQNSVYDEAELTRERSVVLQEIGQAEDTPDDIVFDYFQETAFPDQAMGRPVLGRAEIVRAIARETVASYLPRTYRADRMVLAAAGLVEHDRVVDLAERHFDRLPKGAAPAAEPAAYRGGERLVERELEQVHVVIGFRGVPLKHPDYFLAAVASQLLGGGMSSRLFQEIREKRGLVYSINSFTSSFIDEGLFGIYAGTGETEAAQMMPLVCEEIAKAAQAVEPAEVERAARQLKSSLLMARERTSERCEHLASQMLIYGRPLTVAEIESRIDAVDAPGVSRFIAALKADSPTLVALGPVDHVMPLERLRQSLA